MSWNSTADSGNTEPKDNTDGLASSEFLLETHHWSHLTSHRSFFLPLHYTPSYRYPLVIWLHNNGYNESQIDDVMPYISVRNFIGVGVRGTRAADSIGHRFDWRESPAAVAAAHESIVDAIDEAAERFSIHPSRILVAGYQQGGTMAMRIAMRDPERFAGAVSLGGRMPQGSIRNVQSLRARRLPMLWQWGRGGAHFTEENLKSDCRSLMTIGGQLEVRQYPGEDEMDTVVLRDLNEWIMRRVVSASAVSDSDHWATSPTAYSNN